MSPLLDVQTAAAHVGDPGWVFLDATLPPVGVPAPPDTHARYGERHVPGALFFDIEALSDHGTTLPHTLPSAEDFARAMGVLGVGSDSTLVVYEQAGVFSAPRAWWMLRAFGARTVHVLDGGLEAWVAAGLPVESGPVSRPAARFEARLDTAAVASLAEVQAVLAAAGPVLDARSAGRFAGTAPEPRPGLRSGHMPGATSVPFTELVRDGRLRPAGELAGVFAQKGVDLGRVAVTTCGSGVTAAVVALALEVAGAPAARLYDGSWAEYASQPGAVIVEG